MQGPPAVLSRPHLCTASIVLLALLTTAHSNKSTHLEVENIEFVCDQVMSNFLIVNVKICFKSYQSEVAWFKEFLPFLE